MDAPQDAGLPPDLGRTLLSRVPSPLAYFDASLRCRFANAAYAQALGTTPAQVVGRALADLLGADEFAHRRPLVEAVLAGREQHFEHVVRRAGEDRRLQVRCVPDEQHGRIAGFVVEVTDVTPLRAAQDALRASEDRFRVLSESSPLGVFFADATGARTYVNSRWEEIYGLGAAEGLGDGWMRALHEDDRAAVARDWRAMAAQGRELEMSFRIRRGSDGAVRILRSRTRPVRDGAGAVTGFVGVLEDITDRRAAEERLRASEAFLDSTGRVARVGGWQVDLRTREVAWSDHMRRLCEVDDDYVPGFLRGEDFYPPPAWEQLSQALDAAVRHGRSWDLELPFLTARGRPLWVRVLGEVETEDGRPVRLLGALQDITELRRQRADFAREQERRQESERHAAELDRLLRERSEMLDVLAHEVRQPLNNASAALQSAAAVMAELREPDATSRLARAQAVLGQVMASIDNTLAVASLLARPDPLQRIDTDIDTLLAVTIGDLLPAERGRVSVGLQTGARTVPMDMSLMRLALRNLLANAVRYGAPGSPVVVRVSDSDEPLGLRIDVSNAGGPIPQALVARLFERGAKRTQPDLAPYQGLGLGLYIVRRVMELHGGSVELVANDGGQVAFALVLCLVD